MVRLNAQLPVLHDNEESTMTQPPSKGSGGQQRPGPWRAPQQHQPPYYGQPPRGQAPYGPTPQQPYGPPQGPYSFNQAVPPVQENPEVRAKKERTTKTVGIVAGVAVVAGIGIAAAVGGDTDDSTTASGSTSTTQTTAPRSSSSDGAGQAAAPSPAAQQSTENPVPPPPPGVTFRGMTRNDMAAMAGETLNAKDLSISTTPLLAQFDFVGDPIVCTSVTIQNTSASTKSFNIFEWKMQDPNGAIRNLNVFGGGESIGSGDLAPEGTASGEVCFDGDPSSAPGEYVVLHDRFSFFSKRLAWVNQL